MRQFFCRLPIGDIVKTHLQECAYQEYQECAEQRKEEKKGYKMVQRGSSVTHLLLALLLSLSSARTAQHDVREATLPHKSPSAIKRSNAFKVIYLSTLYSNDRE